MGGDPIVSLIMFVVSTIMQQEAQADAKREQERRQREAEARAASAADAAKGVQITTEGEIAPLRILYGRNLVGGIGAYHYTESSYTYAAAGNNSVVLTATSKLDADVGGSKHEFLVTQQAIGFGGISNVYAIDIDERSLQPQYVNAANEVITNPAQVPIWVPPSGHYEGTPDELGAIRDSHWVEDTAGYWSTGSDPTLTKIDPYSYGARFHIYLDGSVVDPLILVNSELKDSVSTRANSKFTNVAYATCVYRLNRDEPQYSASAPVTQFYAEGMRVRKIEGTYANKVLSSTRTYSNNPPLCIIDYLTNKTYGLGLDDSKIDLDSFYEAYLVCERIVKSNVPIEGALWRAKSSSRHVKLFECNVALDSNKTIRENIEILLDTMNNAMLIWSGGKYKLKLSYPFLYSLSGPSYSAVFANNDIALELSDSLTIVDDLQTTGTKDDLATSLFLNLKDDIKTELVFVDSNNSNITIASYSTYNYLDVVQYSSGGIPRLYKSKINNNNATPEVGPYWEDAVSAYITDRDIIRAGESSVVWPTAATRLNYATVRYLNESRDFKEDSVSWPTKKGVVSGAGTDRGTWSAATGYNTSDKVTYNTIVYQLVSGVSRVSATPPSSDSAWIKFGYSVVYGTFLKEDSGLELETEMFATGISNYYTALAKAEYIVRQSRYAITYEFSVDHNFIDLEPNDFIVVTSNVLNIPGELMRIDKVSPDANGIIKISATKFDAAILAWNVADDEILPVRNIYSNVLPNVSQPSITYTPSVDDSGRIEWEAPNDDRVRLYTIYTTDNYIGAETAWVDRGTTSSLYFDLAPYYREDFYLTVVAKAIDGRRSDKSGWPIKLITYNKIAATTALNIEVLISGVRLSWNPVSSNKLSHFKIFEGATIETALLIGESKTNEIVLPPLVTIGIHKYYVYTVDTNGVSSATYATNSVDATVPGQVSITQNVVDNNVLLYWTEAPSVQAIDYYEVRRGNDFATATLMGKIYSLFATFFETSAGTFKYWISAVDVGGLHGPERGVSVTVNQPPDYVLRSLLQSGLYGEPYHTYNLSGSSVVNAYVDTTYFSGAYAEIDISMPTTSYFEESIDFGEGASLNIGSSTVEITLNTTILSGSPIITTSIKYAPDSGVYNAYVDGSTLGAYNFRFVKYKVTISGTGSVQLNSVTVKLSSKEVTESGRALCYAADSGGTVVTFTRSFVDVNTIQLTPRGTSLVTPVYDFTDTPNPTSFKVLLFNQAGSRVDGEVSYDVTGVI
jgi:hypothetical protein